MNMISLENKLAELERHVGAASSTDKKFAAQRLRHLIAPAFDDEDDLLFDNVPI
jgi:hypothetical protein